ncbi:DUF5787 family protein [Halomarina ordinaria]|uniref:DUF5787 family protein n=1 Tax=Halomarina ordinaria TaxID=3033939 RepID=A0ABD5UAZ5_9EURY|nr:DUF5787 family protein [Halomarina sp. PSRA2]
MREFAFEMTLCARLEGEGRLVSRQLGAGTRGRRVLDTVVVRPGPEFAARTRITPERIPDAAIDADVGTGRARYWKDCFDAHPDRARGVVERACEVGFFERERRSGRTYVRQTVRYPDWFAGLVGIENKPDLGRPGDLETQLRKDVSLAVVDEIVLATESHVTRAHLNRIPEAVGVWRVDGATGAYEVVREPTPLPVRGAGVEVVEERTAETRIRVVGASEKARLRRRIAERAYGKGWRVPFPACPHVEERAVAGVGGIPFCTREERIVGPSDPCACAGAETGDDEVPAVDVDTDARRDEHSPWVREPAGARREQAGLDRFL